MDLLLFQIGPVQDFIAQAATPEDLWAGSYLLSMLMKAGLDVVPDAPEAVIFPNLKDGRVEKALAEGIPTLPNRFWARVPEGEGNAIAGRVKAAILKKLYAYGEGESAAFQKQLEQFLSVSWAVRPETADKGADYKAIARQLALRRNIRDFGPWREEKGLERGAKDFLSGKESALANRRGAMNCVKVKLTTERQYEAPVRNAAKDGDPYYAVIAFDGDRMGAKLSTLPTGEAHRDFSGKLAAFALRVKDLLSEKTQGKSTLVYAGGDDVLAVVPGKRALDCAEALQCAFSETVGADMTASAGIAVGHSKAPFQDLVKAAQAAEHRAKNVYGRDSIALTVLKRSGETIEWGFKWRNSNGQPTAAVELFRKLNTDIAAAKPSARFPYKLAALLRPYALESESCKGMEDVARLELKHAWRQSVEMDAESGKKADLPSEAVDYLDEAFNTGKPEDFLNLFLCETFIDRPREEGD